MNKKVIVECCVDLDDDEYPKVREQIALRGWRRLAAPKQEISIDLIHEFYANAIITEEEMEEHGGHTYRSFVRGVPIDFSPENIRTVMRFRAQVQGSRQEEFFSNHANQYNMIRQEQKLLEKEVLDVKKYQMSAVTMSSGSSSSPTPQRYQPDQALMKIREQHANFSEMQRQLRDWLRNASARECYTVWAHQQANPNLVEMSSQKVVKQIYDNIDHKRPMCQGLLKSDLPPYNSAPPPSSSNDPKNPPK
ncbi:hypothetical protein PIB30_086355 [Stylosanthes scabra]|uniref:Putative plant transposon protein domain-containing protein n=1 Tax=Stylosanthes scabra TaxID=79078 RepID=A0ABU6TW00_9FABA|nr:hypothetical protein [Stylosanthes scabra]